MQTNVLDYLDAAACRVPDKIAYTDGECALTFARVEDHARRIATTIARMGIRNRPVVIFMDKHPHTIAAFYGVIAAGCYYVPIDAEMPRIRIELILESLQSELMICDEKGAQAAKEFRFEGRILTFSEALSQSPQPDAALLSDIRASALDIDPIYVVFTSGSTGTPKGVVACHRSVIDYVEALSDTLGFDEDTVFGSQTPLYVDACLKELYPTLKFGATAVLIPKELFLFPVRLVEFLNEYRINTLCWVVSALTMISSLGAFKKVVPRYLRLVAFGSEVFPIRQFNLWKQTLPEARFFNLYGPTEATGMSCWYEAKDLFPEDGVIPIGRPFKNTQILLLDGEDKPVPDGEVGEIVIRGTSVTLGYYANPEKTGECFVQNPLRPDYPEIVYRTGDLAKRNAEGELIFVSRKDYQIKHMGHRIELGEIEAAVNREEQVRSCCCVYESERKKLVLFYTGDIETAALSAKLKARLPRYMQPNRIRCLERLPQTSNGKIDRKLLLSKASER